MTMIEDWRSEWWQREGRGEFQMLRMDYSACMAGRLSASLKRLQPKLL